MTRQTETLALLSRVPFLSNLGERQLAALSRALKAHEIPANAVLFRQGQPGESMVILARGRLSVRVGPGDAQTEVAAIYPGETVGEMACLDPAPRSATVVASQRSTVFRVKRSTLETIRAHAPSVAVALVGAVITHLTRRIRETNGRIEQEMDRRGMRRQSTAGAPRQEVEPPAATPGRINLKALPCFADFTHDELAALIRIAPARTCKNGHTLCREGEPGQSCFIVARGQVNVVRHMSGRNRVLATLEAGTMLGQMALVDRAPRSATVEAHGDVVVLELQKEAFDALLAAASPIAVRFQEQIAIAGIRQLRTANQRLSGLLNAPQRRAAAKPAARGPVLEPAFEKPRGDGGYRRIPSAEPIHPQNPPRVRPGARPRTEEEDEELLLSYMQTALGEWGMDMRDLDGVRSVRPAGVMPATEKRSRGR